MGKIKEIKKKIPENIKIKAKLARTTSQDPKWLKYASTDKQIVFIFLAGFYQNLGDLAITYAQKRFLQKCFPEAKVVTVPSTETYESIKTIKTFIKPNDIITTIGGGNMDDMYVSLESARIHVVKSFPNNKIISFPQTFAFSKTPFGKKRENISHKVYSKHKNLTIFVREPFSLERVKREFSNIEIGYCPDTVLSLNKYVPSCDKNGVLCCLRNDKELFISRDLGKQIIKKSKEAFSSVTIKDTIDIKLSDCTETNYEKALEDFWDLIRHKEVVITDRMHCMIFCAITGTPCVALDNSNHKIEGMYNAWLKDTDYIRFTNETDAEKIIDLAKKISKLEVSSSIDLSDKFETLRGACLK